MRSSFSFVSADLPVALKGEGRSVQTRKLSHRESCKGLSGGESRRASCEWLIALRSSAGQAQLVHACRGTEEQPSSLSAIILQGGARSLNLGS